MKTYPNSGSINSTVLALNETSRTSVKKILLPVLIFIISLPAFSQELAIVKSSYQHIISVASWTESLKNAEGGASNYMSLTRNSNAYAPKVSTEKNLEVIEGSFKAALDNRRAVINWTSFQDLVTNSYVIERSVNGQPFKEIAQIFTSPEVNAKFDYQYFDRLSSDIKGTIYYRLKVTDTNNQPVYSTVQLASSNKSYENLLVSLKN
jgi:hypothetical protein